jgi:hypothetical protein
MSIRENIRENVPLGPGFSARVVLFAASVPLLLRFVSLPRLGVWLERFGPSEATFSGTFSGNHREVHELALRIDGLVRSARPFVRPGCLVRGLTLYRFLRQAGHDVSLCFGIGLVDGDLMGHCWIEHGGRALAERQPPRPLYTETYRIQPASYRCAASAAISSTA